MTKDATSFSTPIGSTHMAGQHNTYVAPTSKPQATMSATTARSRRRLCHAVTAPIAMTMSPTITAGGLVSNARPVAIPDSTR